MKDKLPYRTQAFILSPKDILSFGIPTMHIFPTRGSAAGQHFSPIVWEAVYNIKLSGFRVLAFACDGASVKRKFFRMRGSTQ